MNWQRYQLSKLIKK